jgi:hypothetical protein
MTNAEGWRRGTRRGDFYRSSIHAQLRVSIPYECGDLGPPPIRRFHGYATDDTIRCSITSSMRNLLAQIGA